MNELQILRFKAWLAKTIAKEAEERGDPRAYRAWDQYFELKKKIAAAKPPPVVVGLKPVALRGRRV